MPKSTRPIVPALMALVALSAVIYSTSRYGPGMTTVSGDYLSAAQSLAAGEGFVASDGGLYVDYPPLYPMVLSPALALGAGAQPAARWGNAVLLALVVLLASLWLLHRLRSTALALAGGAAVLVCPSLLTVATSAFPEPLFILLVLLTLGALSRALAGGGARWYGVAAATASLCCLTRYLGVAAIAAGALVLLFDRTRGPMARRLGLASAFVASGLVPTALWLARNAVVGAPAWGARATASVTPAENIGFALDIMSAWLLPDRLPVPLRIGTILVFGIALAGWMLTRGRRQHRAAVLPPALFAGSYLLILVTVASLVALDRMNSRFLIPLYVPVVALAFLALDDVLRARRPLRAAAVVAVALWCVVYARYTTRHIAGMHAAGAGGYNTVAWQASPTVGALRATPPAGPLLSNDPYAVTILTGLPARLSPRRHMFNSPDTRVDDLARFAAAMDTTAVAHLVWFEAVDRDYLHPVHDLRGAVRLEPARRFPDGVLYRVTVE